MQEFSFHEEYKRTVIFQFSTVMNFCSIFPVSLNGFWGIEPTGHYASIKAYFSKDSNSGASDTELGADKDY